jgi:TRAP-type C4-dicarboxylate transport system permease small subunit
VKNVLIKIEKIFQYYDKIISLTMICGILFLIVMSFLNVFFRYVLQSSAIYWADELLRYSMIWLVFIGATIGVSRKLHVRIDVVQKYLPEKLCYWLTLMGYICMLVFSIVMARQGHLFSMTGNNTLSVSLSLKMDKVYLIIPICFVLMSINIFRLIIREYILKGYFFSSEWGKSIF